MTQTAKQLASAARQAITTHLLPATDHLGSQITAQCEAHRLTVGWDHRLNIAENHAKAALALFRDLGWDEHNALVMGSDTGTGFVFVQVPKAVEGRYFVSPGRTITETNGGNILDIVEIRRHNISPVRADALTHWIAAQMSSDSFDLNAIEAAYMAET